MHDQWLHPLLEALIFLHGQGDICEGALHSRDPADQFLGTRWPELSACVDIFPS